MASRRRGFGASDSDHGIRARAWMNLAHESLGDAASALDRGHCGTAMHHTFDAIAAVSEYECHVRSGSGDKKHLALLTSMTQAARGRCLACWMKRG